MALDLDRFVHCRPVLYHLTAKSNLSGIQAAGMLMPAAHILRRSGERKAIRTKRSQAIEVKVSGRTINIRDQAPLHAGNLALSGGWTFADFVEHLNEHVFFWPGNAKGPISYGLRHFARYRDGDNVVLAVDTAKLLSANPRLVARFCRFNSGSPRCSGGRPSPRGPKTFQPPEDFASTPSQVVEVTFLGIVRLPKADLVVLTPSSFV